MTELYIDIETFSSVDLTKCGVYKYAESPDFEILLFGYSVDKSVPMMHDESETICKPFKRHHSEQLKLVSSFGWIDFSALNDVGEMIERILSDENAKDYMEEKRIHTIADLTERRIKILQSVAGEKRRTQIISTDDEVGENVAASYDDKK